jgi:nitroreductase
MNDVIKALIERRSCKNFDPNKIVEKEKLDLILEAGKYAANGRGLQAATMVVIQNKETISKIAKLNAAVLNASNINPFYNATTLVVVFANPVAHTYVEDGSLVMGNLMIAAHSLGVDSCWIHRAKEVFASEEGQKLKKEWGIAENLVGIGNCVLGYRAADLLPPKPRKSDFVRYVD